MFQLNHVLHVLVLTYQSLTNKWYGTDINLILVSSYECHFSLKNTLKSNKTIFDITNSIPTYLGQCSACAVLLYLYLLYHNPKSKTL